MEKLFKYAFLGGWFRGFVKVLFQRSFDRHLDAGALLALAALRRNLVDVCRGTRCAVSLRQPLLQQRLQLTHVLKAKLQGFEPGYIHQLDLEVKRLYVR